jgi:transposase
VLVVKQLSEDKFRWPRRHDTVVRLTSEQMHWILDGIDIDAMVRHPVRHYQVAG